MNTFSPGQLAQWTRGAWLDGVRPEAVSGFSNDTRALKRGDCFVALRTGQRDGHDFLAIARESGAAAALVSTPVPSVPVPQLVVPDTLAALQEIARAWRGRFGGVVFGVTGSVGKTSTKDMLRRILGGRAFATEGNLNNLLGVPLMLARLDEKLHDHAVIEAGMSEPGELERAAWMIRPDVALVTNVQPAHLAGLGSLGAIAREKSALARGRTPGGVAVFPASCLAYPEFAELTGAVVVAFPDDAPAAPAPGRRVFCVEFFPDENGRRIALREDGAVAGEFLFPESTEGMAANAALAAVACLVAGVPFANVRAALAGWRPSARRGESVRHAGKLFYIDCYNASPASMVDAARLFAQQTRTAPARLFVLAGMNELGAESATLHRAVGRKLPLRAGDRLVLFGGDAAEIGAGAVSSGFAKEAVSSAGSIDAVRAAVADFPGPVLLKGSRSYALERALPEELQGDGGAH